MIVVWACAGRAPKRERPVTSRSGRATRAMRSRGWDKAILRVADLQGGRIAIGGTAQQLSAGPLPGSRSGGVRPGPDVELASHLHQGLRDLADGGAVARVGLEAGGQDLGEGRQGGDGAQLL